MRTLKEAYLKIKERYPNMGIKDVCNNKEFFVFFLVPKGMKAFGSPWNPVIISKVEGKEFDIAILESDDNYPDLGTIWPGEIEKVFSPEDYALYDGYQNEIVIG